MDRRRLLKNSASASALILCTPSLNLPFIGSPAAAQSLEPRELIFNLRIQDRRPAMLTGDIRQAMAEALRSGKPLRVLAGGHGYIGQALAKDGVVIDMRNQRQVTLDAESGILHVQAGARFIEIYRALSDAQGELQFVLPTGDCPTVGVAGYTLGGGYGHLSRQFGLMCDNVVGLKVWCVDTSGQISEKFLTPASQGEDGELFWALRGGGSARFAVVSDFYFQLRKKPAGLKIYDIRLRWDLNATEIAQVLRTWQNWLSQHIDDKTLSSKLALGSGWYHISGLHSDVSRIHQLRDLLSPYINQQESAYERDFKLAEITSAFKQCTSLSACEAQPKQAFAAKSAFLGLDELSRDPEGIARLLSERRQQYGTYGGIELMAWRMQGGLHPENAFVHRSHDLLCQFYTEGYADERDPWMQALFRSVTGQEQNSQELPGYQNYTDATIAGAETGFPAAYFPGVTQRLESVRARYRPLFT